jgi:tRNA-uridine aminocarboxypropyltransferase
VTATCSRCLVRDCLCADIPVVPTRTRIVIVRHASELYRSSNSGRLAHLALPNSEILDHAIEGAPIDDARLAIAGSWLLYPEGEPRTRAPEPPPSRLIVLDGTWQQSRRMRQRLIGLRGLPVLRLPDEEAPPDRLRASPGRGLVSTIEAIARALRLLEGDAPADALDRLFARAVANARASGRFTQRR